MGDTLSETETLMNEYAASRDGAVNDVSLDAPSNDGTYPQAIGALLQEHRGGDVIVLDLRELNAWTDFFVIATVTSSTHLDGLERHIADYCREHDLQILRKSRKPTGEDDEWRLIDLGSIVIHLMSERARAFYELERLYAAKS